MKKLATMTLISMLALGSYAVAQGPGRPFFDKLDTNHDGKLTKAEAQADAASRFAKIDANRDGKATKDELQAHHEAMRAEHGDKHKRGDDAQRDEKRAEKHARKGEHFFSKLDANADGVLDSTEFTQGLLKRFDRMDANHDGVVVADELREGFGRGKHGGPCGDGHGPRGEQEGQAGTGADERG